MQRTQIIQQITKEILEQHSEKPLMVGIDGIDGAGKSTLASELKIELESKKQKVILASIDSFHKPKETKYKKGKLSPEGYYDDSFDYQFLIHELLKPIKNHTKPTEVRTAKFDYKSETEITDSKVVVEKNHILLFEGVFLFRPEIDIYWDFKIFIDINFESSLNRGLDRDSDSLEERESIKEKYLKRYPGSKNIS